MLLRPFMLLLLGCVLSPAWGAPLTDAMHDDLVSAQIVSDVASGEPLRLAPQLIGFYTARMDAPGWVTDTSPLPAAREMLEAVRRSADDGLHPEDYHLQALERLFNSLKALYLPGETRRRRLAALELLLSDAFLLLGEHEAAGRMNPAAPDGLIFLNLESHDLMRELAAAMSGGSPQSLLRGLAPQAPGYEALRQALARYRSLQAAGAPEVADGPPLHATDSGPRVQALIGRLQAEGDLSLDPATGTVTAEALEEGIVHFQGRHGLQKDGIADAATLAYLSESPQDAVDRIRVNLERWRRLPQNPGGTRVVVNIADFRVSLYQDGQLLSSEPAVVGETYSQTPEFNDRIRYLVINPSWDVPPMIGGDEILPEVQRDPKYLGRHGYVVLQGWGTAEHVVDPGGIDWSRWTAETLPYRFRQLPGPDNALGRVKFMFPNRYGVYLHDSPAQQLFSEQCRAFSHGCIRMANAMKLAETLLRLEGYPKPAETLREAATGGETREIDLTEPVPIYIVYFTAWVDGAGVLQFRPDIYGRDPEVLRELDAPLQVIPDAATLQTRPVPVTAAARRPGGGL